MDPTRWFVDLPTQAKRAVDRACVEFERADPPRPIEGVLPRVPDRLRPALLTELVAIEVERRRAAGEVPTATEYAERFPADADAVRAAFWQAAGTNVGGTLGKYKLTGVLGRGGMGVVYEAADPVIDRKVAVKVLPNRLLADPMARNRLLQEARLAGQLLHPNVVTLFEVGEADGVMFLVLERVAGGSAADRLTARGAFDWRAAVRVAVDACRGLAAIHAAGFLHLDIKPANVLLPAGPDAPEASDPSGGVVAKLADFSLAMTGGAEAAADGSGAGTPAYMSPEQRAGGPVSRRTDVYGVGATLYALVTGRAPFAGATVTEVMAAQARGPLPDPKALNPELPDAVARVVTKAMAADPKARHGSAEELLADLQAVLGPPKPAGRRWLPWTVAAGAAVALVAVLGFGPDGPLAEPAGRPAPTAPRIDTWEQLFDGHDLDGWTPVPFTDTIDTPGTWSIVSVDGLPVLRASGEGLTAIETERQFENFHLRFEYRWGASAGLHLASVRYHCTGPVGSRGTHGMELHLRNAGSYIRRNQLLRLDLGEIQGRSVVPADGPAPFDIPPWSNDREAPIGRWNRAALVCVNDWMIHVINGTPVLALARSRTADDTPLTKGRLRLQSSKGEVFFRKIEVRRATEIPAEYLSPPSPAPATRRTAAPRSTR